ncbi:Pol, partial [Symbiodinium microadriaticum]
MWHLCSETVGALLGPALCRHYSAGQVAAVEGDWKDTSVIWLPKPSKKPTTVASMRPIGLQSPATKSFASALKVAVMEHLTPVVTNLPQYAYLPSRGTTDALLKVHQHFEDTAALIASNRVDRFQQKAGKHRLSCVGGISLSLDLSSAFDGVHRPTAYQTMLQHGVDRTTVDIIQSLHQQARYHFTVGSHTSFVCTTNGIKQGCTIAPSIWAFFTVAVMLKMTEARSMHWLQQVCTLFADDCWGSWLISSERDVTRAIEDIIHIITVLEDFHLRVNYQKTAVLLRLEGKSAERALNACTVEKDGTSHLEVLIRGESRLIPIKTQHEYLGTAVTYHHRQDANTQKRMQAGQLRYQDIRRVLNGRHVLTVRQRTSLWRSCIYSSLVYSIPVVGLTPKSNQKLYVQTTRHLRAIARQPAHLHHTPKRTIWEDRGLRPPAAQAQQLLQQHRDKIAARSITNPDITNTQQTMAYVDSLLERFYRWGNLKEHIRTGACEKLGGDAAVRYPHKPATDVALPGQQLAEVTSVEPKNTSDVLDEGPAPPQPVLPRALRPDFRASLHQWDQQLRTATMRTELAQYCVLCGMWIADTKMENQDAQLADDIYQACFPSGQAPLLPSPADPAQSFPNKRPRPELRSRARQGDRRGPPAYHPSPFQQGPPPPSPGISSDTFTQMCRLMLRHEEQLALLKQDRGLVVFVKQDQHSILPALYKASTAWNEKKDKAVTLEAGLTLKTVLLSCVIKEILSRLQTVTATEAGKGKLQTAGWINADGHWVYQRWCQKTRRLVLDEARTPLSHDNAVRLLTTLRDSLTGDIIQKFSATQPLYKLEEAGHQSATFFLEVSLRGKESDAVHSMLLQLVNNTMTHLVGISIKRENGQRSKLAQQIAEMVAGAPDEPILARHLFGFQLLGSRADGKRLKGSLDSLKVTAQLREALQRNMYILVLVLSENTILQLQTDLRRQQKLILDMLTRLQILEQKLLYHGRHN